VISPSPMSFGEWCGFELRALSLLGRCSTTWAMSPVLSASVIFWAGTHICALVSLDHSPANSASYIAGMMDVCYLSPVFIIKMEPCELFCLCWPQTIILPSLPPKQLGLIIGVTYFTHLKSYVFKYCLQVNDFKLLPVVWRLACLYMDASHLT
jgi:hypothetical protein